MTKVEAEQIAALINRRNKLARQYRAADVLKNASNYEFETRESKVAACVERKEVQWYQWEICHLSVGESWEGKGLAYMVYSRTEDAARSGGACLLQCTIRVGNNESETFFSRQGFKDVGTFHYPATGNNVGIWQKVLSTP